MVDSARFQSPVVAGSVAAAYFANWAITDWYLDAVVGDDTNPGTSAALPLRTGGELANRLGPHAIWQQSVTVHVLANGLQDPLVLRGELPNPGTHLDVVGVPTQLADGGTIVSYQAVNHATPTATEISCTGIADWTAYQWRRVRVTGGARAGYISWIAAANPAGAGLNVARISPVIGLDQTSLTGMFGVSAWQVGDPIVVESLPEIPSVSILLTGNIDTNGATPIVGRRLWSIQNISTLMLDVSSPIQPALNYKVLFGNRLSVVNWNLASQVSTLNIAAAMGCSFYVTPGTGTAWPITSNLQCCLLGEGNATGQASLVWNMFMQRVLFQGIPFNGSVNCQLFAADLQVFDVPNALRAWDCCGGSILNLSGANNANYGLGLRNNTNCILTGTINIQGALGNGRFTTAPAATLTLPQILQPNDYAQKGTAQLAMGSVAVVVPWWDPTIQKLTLSYNTPPASPGFLSAPAASRTSTGFVINSSVPTDNGTVDWQISPLGRNIMIST